MKLGIQKVDGGTYYKICENFLHPFDASLNCHLGPRWQCRPNLCPPETFFCLILQKFCDFSWTWDLRYFIFLRCKFCPKLAWTVNFRSVPFVPKSKNFEGRFKHCACLIGRTLLFKI